MHDGASCGYGCDPGVGTAALDALGGGWARLEAPTEHTQGQREGTRGSQIVRMRQKGAEFEA